MLILIVQNGVAGIWYNYTVGHCLSAPRGLLRWLPGETSSPYFNQVVFTQVA